MLCEYHEAFVVCESFFSYLISGKPTLNDTFDDFILFSMFSCSLFWLVMLN